MDKKTILAWVLIAVVFAGWLIYSSVYEAPKPVAQKTEQKEEQIEEKSFNEDTTQPAGEQIVTDSLSKVNKFGSYFSGLSEGSEENIKIETGLVEAVLSSKGAVIKKWRLKNYTNWNDDPAQMIWNDEGELYLTFLTIDGKKIDTRDLFWEFSTDKNDVNLQKDEKATITARLQVAPDKYIEKTFTFEGGKYAFQTDIKLHNLQDVIPSRGYNYMWSGGLRYMEKNSVDESNEAIAMVVVGGDEEELNADDDEPVESSLTGNIEYAAVKTKFFGAAIEPNPGKNFDGTVDLSGERIKVRNKGLVEKYDIAVRIPYRGGTETMSFRNYIGPLDYDLLQQYGYTNMVNFGWYFIRPIGEYFIKPILSLAYTLVGSWGIAIIILAFVMKIILYPLSIKQMQSTQKMKLLQPEMQKIREQYKDDSQKQQQETMKLYSRYGINPMGGCLPLLLQMPILYALWTLLRTSIELRQAEFLWITDLSTPDYLFHLGTSFMGISGISTLALLMGISMFLQQKMTITDPRQKSIIYIMPVMFVILFSSFPAGLNLYYFMFNILAILHQLYINNFSKNKYTLADLERAPKKEGWLQKKMREAQEIAESQGRVPKGTYTKQKGNIQKPQNKPNPKRGPNRGSRNK